MTTTRYYKSTDAGAPVLTGQNGSMLNLLDKCLVDGYGSQTAAGWTRAFTGTNKTVYRNSLAAGGSGMYLRVDDSGGGTGGAREALARCYLTMSDIDTGTVETPEVAQLASSIVWRKSATLDSTPREWLIVADERTVYLCIDSGTYASGMGCLTGAAGDFDSNVPGDAYAFFIAGRQTQQAAGSQGSAYGLVYRAQSWATQGASGGYVARGHAGTGAPLPFAIPTLALTASGGGSAIGGGTYSNLANPLPGSGLTALHPAFIANESTLRGRLRGLFVPLCSYVGVTMGTDYPSMSGMPSGSVLTTLRHAAAESSTDDDGHVFVETALEW